MSLYVASMRLQKLSQPDRLSYFSFWASSISETRLALPKHPPSFHLRPFQFRVATICPLVLHDFTNFLLSNLEINITFICSLNTLCNLKVKITQPRTHPVKFKGGDSGPLQIIPRGITVSLFSSRSQLSSPFFRSGKKSRQRSSTQALKKRS